MFRNLCVVNGVPTFDASQPYRDFLAFPSSFIGGAVVAAADMGSTRGRTERSNPGCWTGRRKSSSAAAPA